MSLELGYDFGREGAVKSPMRRALVAYAGLFALLDVVGPRLSDANVSVSAHGPSLAVSLVIQVLIVWGLSRGSVIAWTFGLLGAVAALLFVIVAGAGFDREVSFVTVVAVGQAWFLLTQPLRRRAWSTRQAAAASRSAVE